MDEERRDGAGQQVEGRITDDAAEGDAGNRGTGEVCRGGERITMPKRGVNWAFLKINTN
jgi:hypothetical protein